MKSILITLGIFAFLSNGFGQDLFGNSKEAYVLMPSRAIASSVVRQVDLSPSGRLIFYRQVLSTNLDELLGYDSPEMGKWFVYDRVSMNTTALKFPGVIREMSPLGDDKTVYFISNNGEGLLNIATGNVTSISLAGVKRTYFGEKAYAPFIIGCPNKETLQIYYLNGTTTSVKIDPTITLHWLLSGDAKNLTFYGSRKTNAKRSLFTATLNMLRMEVSYRDYTPEDHGEDGSRPSFTREKSGDMDYILLFNQEQIIQSQAPNSTNVKPTPRPPQPAESTLIPKMTRLGPTGGIVTFSPKGDYVVYQDAGSLLVRDIQPIDPNAAQKLAMNELKKQLLHKVKEVGLGFIMYGGDNDDVFPGQEGWEDKLKPYLRNSDSIRDFNYLYRGGDVSKLDNPATTELGFMVGPGGRAVVYMDGHAKWIPNP